MVISDSLLSDLKTIYKRDEEISKILDKKQIYKLADFNILQISKIFDIDTKKVFADSNSRKHLVKVIDMIKNSFSNDITSNYFQVFFYPQNDISEYEKRKDIISSIFYDGELHQELKKILKSFKSLNKKIVFKQRIITLDSFTEKYFFDKYSLHIEYVTSKELEEMSYDGLGENLIILSEEDLFVEAAVYDLKEFERILIGNLIKNNSSILKDYFNLMELLRKNEGFLENILGNIKKISGVDLDVEGDFFKIVEEFSKDDSLIFKELTSKVLRLEEEVEKINLELKEKISKKQLSLQGDELLNLLNSGNVELLQKKFNDDIKEVIVSKEKEIVDDFKLSGIKIDFLFSENTYPLKLDDDVKDNLLKQIDKVSLESELKMCESLGRIYSLNKLEDLFNFMFFLDMFLGIKSFEKKLDLKYPLVSDSLELNSCRNIYLSKPMPISYAIGSNKCNDVKLGCEKVSILTGANSGGKTTLLEMFLQSLVFSSVGFGIAADSSSSIRFFDEIIYLKKFTGTAGSGAFEQTVRGLVDILDSESSKMILIDEFEAVTEPGAAARILIMFLREISKQDSFCISVSHLGQEIKEFIKEENISGIRIDGISAKGLDENGNLITEHQPQFYELGKSTPELILKRILQDEKFWKQKSQRSKEIFENLL